MNREILFRGQRLDNKEEIEGYYCKFGWLGKEKHYIIPSDASACTPIEVDPNTICQYIGRTDKKGVKIFEGDSASVSVGKNTKTSTVTYNKKLAAFVMEYSDGTFDFFSDVFSTKQKNKNKIRSY